MNKIPIKSILRLGNAIKRHKNKFKVGVSAKKKINFELFGQKSIVYLESGSINLHRKNDGVLIYKFDQPFVIGLDHLFSCSEYYNITPNEDVMLYLLTHEDAIDVLDKENLWKDIAIIMAYTLEIYEHRSHSFAEHRNVYDIVKVHLEMIWDLPEEERNKISIFDYILKRHNISRSSVAKILKELNNGDYISTKRGKLINLNKLPIKY